MNQFLRILFLVIFILPEIVVSGQKQVSQRIILIGDAGEINNIQETLIPDAAKQHITGKTTVLFLGDNVYPRGLNPADSLEYKRGVNILKSQYKDFRTMGIPVYFLPGNHDWDKSGKNGYRNIVAMSDYFKTENDSGLKLVPQNGCPDPIDIPLGDDAVIIAYDSEWWLFPSKNNQDFSDCNCNEESEILEKLSDLLWKYRDRNIILASHHPFRTYGVHGGKYTWKDHLFPLTAANKKLMIPMPVIGSLYPLLRQTAFVNPEDIGHPAYKHLINSIENVVNDLPNIVFAAGHEHGMQLIKDKNLHIVSGAGAKSTPIKKGRYSLYANNHQGYAVLDILADKSLEVRYYVLNKNGVFEEAYQYAQPFKPYSSELGKQYEQLKNMDSIEVVANERYNETSRLYRTWFGENYRKEWSTPVKLPVLKLGSLNGGMVPLQRGGGMQTISLRLADASGKEWVLRKVRKNPKGVLPEGLTNSFAEDLVDDYMSSQHPYSALVMPVLANAADVPHSNPRIGVVAPDTNLNVYTPLMVGSMALLEEREPLGNSDNSIKFKKQLSKDNENTFKAKSFLRAMMLDLLVSDWDRHEDQWRWKNVSKNEDKDYLGVPRDRDQALKVNNGIIPWLVSRSWLMPTFQGFQGNIPSVKYSLYKHRFVYPTPEFQFSRKEWDKVVAQFVAAITDSVIMESLNRLPYNIHAIRNEQLLLTMKERRDHIPAAMTAFYQFINEIVDIRLSEKNEFITISDAANGNLNITVNRVNKSGEIKKVLMDKTYDAYITKEVRLYLDKGSDSLVYNVQKSKIRVSVITAGKQQKHIYSAEQAKPFKLYGNGDYIQFSGNSSNIRKHLSADSANKAFVQTNLYNVTMPILNIGFNKDDGLIIGGGFRKTIQKGFRKLPYTSQHQLIIQGSFATGAYWTSFKNDWIDVFGKADLEFNAHAWTPKNNQNFFGVGNETEYDKSQGIIYYRSRYNLIESELLLRFNKPQQKIKIGPVFQYFNMTTDRNEHRFILLEKDKLNSYDSASILKDKAFAGIKFSFERDSRNNKMFTSSGGKLHLDIEYLNGVNRYSKTLLQVRPSLAMYFPLDKAGNITLANRLGGGVTFGHAAFYQSMFLGGQSNLRGYRQFRFAGDHMIYNNMELRMKLLQTGSYILPGQLGTTAFFDAGKVWAKSLNSPKVHMSVGGGLYFAPAKLVVFQFLMGYSTEGWYPHFTTGFRF